MRWKRKKFNLALNRQYLSGYRALVLHRLFVRYMSTILILGNTHVGPLHIIRCSLSNSLVKTRENPSRIQSCMDLCIGHCNTWIEILESLVNKSRQLFTLVNEYSVALTLRHSWRYLGHLWHPPVRSFLTLEQDTVERSCQKVSLYLSRICKTSYS
jgi:hypothetical protein